MGTSARSGWVVAVVLGMLLAAVGTAGGVEGNTADEPRLRGGDLRISGRRAVDNEAVPVLAHNTAANQYLAVWSDRRPDVNHWDIYGQLVRSDGKRFGRDFRINNDVTLKDQYEPAVVYNATEDEYLVVWQDNRRMEERKGDIYGQRVSADGRLLGRNFRVNGRTGTEQDGEPIVAWNSTRNEYLVVYEGWRGGTSGRNDLYAQRLDEAGAKRGREKRVSGPKADNLDTADLAYNPDTDQYLVVWADLRDPADRGIYGRRLTRRGAPIGPELSISSPAADRGEASPAVAYNGTAKQYLVVWIDRRPWEGSLDAGDVYGRRLNRVGAVRGPDFRISGRWAREAESFPDVAYNPTTDRYLVVWSDARDWRNRDWDVFGRRVHPKGAPEGRDFRISASKRAELRPTLACNITDNEYLVIWEDDRNDYYRGDDIYGRVVTG